MAVATRRGTLAVGLLLGVAADALLGDPRRGHPVAGFGRAAAALERRMWADSVPRGAAYATVCIGSALFAGTAVRRLTRRHPLLATLATAAATWAVVGGESLAREGAAMASALERDDLPAARLRLPHLCGRDPSVLDGKELARATVESLAENTSDAVVAPLFWGAVAGLPGLLGYRAVNTLDAMIGHRNPRHDRFGRVAARLDDAANWLPARLTGALMTALAPSVGGDRVEAWRVLRSDGGRHPSPNAGRCEAAMAGALGVRLGGVNVYGGRVEHRPSLGAGPPPAAGDVRRAVRLSRLVGVAAAGLAAVGAGARW